MAERLGHDRGKSLKLLAGVIDLVGLSEGWIRGITPNPSNDNYFSKVHVM